MRRFEEKMEEVDWNLMIVLDACRWDVFRDVVGDCEVVWSPASATREWCGKMRKKLGGCVVINANPEVSEYLRPEVDVRVWKFGWIEDGVMGTVDPEVMVNVVNGLRVRPRRKVIAWFMQPHSPYWKDRMLMHQTYVVKGGRMLRIEDEVEELREAYRRNLEWVIGVLREKLEWKRWKVVVTADHGECLGENGKFGHWCGSEESNLRMVPWWEGSL